VDYPAALLRSQSGGVPRPRSAVVRSVRGPQAEVRPPVNPVAQPARGQPRPKVSQARAGRLCQLADVRLSGPRQHAMRYFEHFGRGFGHLGIRCNCAVRRKLVPAANRGQQRPLVLRPATWDRLLGCVSTGPDCVEGIMETDQITITNDGAASSAGWMTRPLPGSSGSTRTRTIMCTAADVTVRSWPLPSSGRWNIPGISS
jgi:hypothetical protein